MVLILIMVLVLTILFLFNNSIHYHPHLQLVHPIHFIDQHEFVSYYNALYLMEEDPQQKKDNNKIMVMTKKMFIYHQPMTLHMVQLIKYII
eukprot:UN04176